MTTIAAVDGKRVHCDGVGGSAHRLGRGYSHALCHVARNADAGGRGR
jgi:hypothetical protein